MSSLLSTPKFTLIGNVDLWSCHTDFKPKCRQKKAFVLVFLDISTRSSQILKMSGLVCTLLCQGQCFPFSSPNLQWFSRYDFLRNIIRLLAGPARTACLHPGQRVDKSWSRRSWQVPLEGKVTIRRSLRTSSALDFVYFHRRVRYPSSGACELLLLHLLSTRCPGWRHIV